MEINLYRRRYTRWGVDGYMEIGGEKFCGTTEHPLLLLPEGRYKIELLYDPKMSRKMPAILMEDENISLLRHKRFKYFSAFPLIMPGNGPMDLKCGSIVVGKPVCSGLISHTEEYFTRLYDRLRRCKRKGILVVLNIRKCKNEIYSSDKDNLFTNDNNKQKLPKIRNYHPIHD